MFRLASILYSLIGTSLAGIGIIAVLTMGYVTVKAIVVTAIAGFVLAMPVAWIVARQIYSSS